MTDPNPGADSAVFTNHRVVLCLGSGGVGKTTVAAAIGLALADRGERVVVLTIDPAHRLADALGLESGLDNEPRRVSAHEGGGELWATMLDQAETFEAVVREEARTTEQAERILANPLFRNLTRSLSGTNEYMAAERLHQLHGDARFDRIVVDTPPSRHALDFLDSPGRLNRFVNHRLYRSVFAPRGLLRTVGLGTQLVLRLLGRIVGSRLVDDVVTFFANFEGLDAGFDRRATETDRILREETGFVLITAPRRRALDEACWIAANVARRVGPVDAIVVNRMCPVSTDSAAVRVEPDEPPGGADGPLAVNLRQLRALAAEEALLIDDAIATIGGRPTVVQLAERALPVAELETLRELAGDLSRWEAGQGRLSGPD
ncbi:MAG: AAA family ATPase [Acidimicrobiia bacterium]|nr:AAA family ATPase [Acidimicrobiia bacterium]